MTLANGGLAGWQVVRSDDREGVVEAQAKRPLLGGAVQVKIQVGLDANAQTRVDAAARGSTRGSAPGIGARRIKSFFRALDRELAVRPEQLLAPWPPRVRAR